MLGFARDVRNSHPQTLCPCIAGAPESVSNKPLALRLNGSWMSRCMAARACGSGGAYRVTFGAGEAVVDTCHDDEIEAGLGA
jgi:hypothetical protein